LENGECFRADVLIKNYLADFVKSYSSLPRQSLDEINEIILRIDSYSPAEFDEIIKKFKIKSPISQNELSNSIPFNLMFQCQLGPEGKNVAFLRPETAQGRVRKNC